MANFYNPKYDTSELIKYTENTVERANFQQIQESLTNKMKEIYGNDIDLTSTTADGQWIMARSLLIDKMFEVIDNLNQSLNPATARGNFLDIICSFNNVFRKGQSYSKVKCYVKPLNENVKNGYIKTSDDGERTWQEIKCIDNNGNTWTWYEDQNIDGTYKTYFNSIPAIPCEPTEATGVAVADVEYYEKSSENTYTPGYLVDSDGYKYTPKEVVVGTTDVSNYFTFENDAKKGRDEVQKSAYVYTPLTFVCDNAGAVNANKGNFDKNNPNDSYDNHGDVGKVIDINRYPFNIWQVEDAEVGSDVESDQSLRTRRELEMSNNSITVLSGLEASLRQVNGIKDVKIINNPNTDSLPTTNINGGDNGVIQGHNIYVILRYEKDIDEENIKKNIGETIYNKLTPGVLTESNANITLSYGEMENYDITYDLFTTHTIISWKKCESQKYPITLNLLINKDYDDNKYYSVIVNAIKNYIINLSLNEKLTISGIVNAINTSCIPVNGMNPYIALNGSINLGTGHTQEQYAENHLSYFDYSDASFTHITETSDDNYVTRTLTISV